MTKCPTTSTAPIRGHTPSSIAARLDAGIATSVSTVMQSNFTHIYQAELFHTTNRSTAIGISHAASRLVGALLPLAALSLLAAIGSGGLYTCCALVLGATALAIRLLGPRTNNQQLDTI
jgi:MFS transporter, putative metabolite:H+ symporter